MPQSLRKQAEAMLEEMPLRDLDSLLASVREAITRRRSDGVEDMEALAVFALQEVFTEKSVRPPLQVAPGVLALGGQIVDSAPNSPRHKCTLYTVFPDGEHGPEMWAWDDALSSRIHSERSKVGTKARSVSLQAAMTGMVIVQHHMTTDGKGHERSSVNAWRVAGIDDDGDITLLPLPAWVPAKLPPPHGGNSTASRYAGRR